MNQKTNFGINRTWVYEISSFENGLNIESEKRPLK